MDDESTEKFGLIFRVRCLWSVPMRKIHPQSFYSWFAHFVLCVIFCAPWCRSTFYSLSFVVTVPNSWTECHSTAAVYCILLIFKWWICALWSHCACSWCPTRAGHPSNNRGPANFLPLTEVDENFGPPAECRTLSSVRTTRTYSAAAPHRSHSHSIINDIKRLRCCCCVNQAQSTMGRFCAEPVNQGKLFYSLIVFFSFYF